MATKFLLALFLSLLVSAALGQQQQREPQLSASQECQLKRIRASQPSERIEHEGGVTELWDENEDQFQCAGVAPLRNTLRPNSLSLVNYHPSPRVVFIEKGQGWISLLIPGCPQTFHSREDQGQQQGQGEQGQGQQGQGEQGQGQQGQGQKGQGQGQGQGQGGKSQKSEKHQQVHRVYKGDIIAIPAGVAHWCYNDGNEELVALSITDLNNHANQLDNNFRAFYLAGSLKTQGQQGEKASQKFHNILNAFDAELLAEAYNVPVELVRKMQKQNDKGLIVNVREKIRLILPEEQQQEQGQSSQGGSGSSNGIEENWCSVKIRTNIERAQKADIFSRQAGSLSIASENKLPILQQLGMSAERGRLAPNALLSPHWQVNSHSAVYAIRGDAQVQVVGPLGETVLNDRVKERSLFIVPQFYAVSVKAGRNGFEWVSLKTSSQPVNSPLAGYASVFRALPVQVIKSSYQVSQNEAQELKNNRKGHVLLSPGSQSQTSP